MSVYPPPIHNYSRYNSLNFIQETSTLTIADGDTRYLRLSGGIVTGGTTFTSSLTNTNRTYISDGAESTPSLTLTNSTGTGLSRVGTNGIAISTNGAYHTHFHTTYQESFNPIRVQNGSKTSPSITFSGNTNTGIYRDLVNGVAISTDGSQRLYINSTKLEPFQAIHEVDGSITTPSYSFKNSTNSGFYLNNGTDPTITRNGINVFELQSGQTLLNNISTLLNSGRYSTAQIGSASIPTFQYYDGKYNDSGIFFKASTREPSISHNSNLITEFGSSSITLYKPMLSSYQSYKFYRASTSQTITYATVITLDYATIENEQNASDITRSVVSSKARYTVYTTGIYMIVSDFSSSAASGGATSLMYTWMGINDSGASGNRYVYKLNYINDYHIFQSMTIVKLTAGQYLSFFAYTGTPASYSPTFPLDISKNTYLQIYRLC